MEKFLITQSLLSSWMYMFDCPEGGEEDAKADFVRTLNREKKEPTDAMLNGIEFENAVYAAAAGVQRTPHPKWESGIQKVAAIVRGAPVQVRVQRDIEVCGMTFVAYGILDVLKAGTIYDVKFKSRNFKDVELAGAYLESPQHPMYFYIVPEARDFVYLVSDGSDLYTERYTPDTSRPISDIIGEFILSITSMGLLDIYKEKWLAK